MDVNKPTLQEKLTRLRMSFLSQMPARLDKAQQQFSALSDDWDSHASQAVDLHRFFHSIKGTASSFGFTDLAHLAGEGETIMLALIETQDSTEAATQIAPLGSLLSAMKQQLKQLQSHTSSDNGTQSAPSFEMEQFESNLIAGKRKALIYICDDEPEQVSQLGYQLHCFGYSIEFFTDTLSFREAVMKRRPDAVIMDVYFPNGSTAGTDELARLSQVIGEALPAIVLSGYGDFEARLGAVRAGCLAYFTKPARALDLAAKLDELLEGDNREEQLRILVVDDEPEVAAYHSLILQEAGMSVRQLHDPSGILDALQQFNPDLVLADMYMPRCTGVELAAIVRQLPEYVSLPIVYLSSETNRQKQFSAMQVGVEGFITKPVVPEELVAAVVLRAERMRTLRALMSRDSLTGLYNHTSTTEMLHTSLAQAMRLEENLVVVMLDLDNFKAINDLHGHMAGDQVLIALSRILRHRLRSSDIIGRYGGEEFALLLKGVTPGYAEKLVNQLREDFSNIAFTAGKARFNCTFSAGISCYPDYTHADSLRLAADRALYQAKNQGRNQVVVSRPKHD
ncbi:MAG: diguanylate cyclase [Nitrincola lacisaponensis]|uniref:diguanylate cyclase n=1 Tax=Nitrincola lacisaponensis TaxID=267850 RepID=UPI00391D638C